MAENSPKEPPAKPNGPSMGWTDTINWMQEWFAFLYGIYQETNIRIDRLVELSGRSQRFQEVFGKWREGIDLELAKIQDLLIEQTHFVEEKTAQVDQREQLMSLSIDRIERSFETISARYQQSLTEIWKDNDESLLGIQNQIEEIRQRRQQETTEIVTAKIGRNERIVIAFLVLMGGVVSSLFTLLIEVLTRGRTP